MTIVRSPLFSEMRGKFFKYTLRVRRNNKIEFGLKRIPKNPRSLKQQEIRSLYRKANEVYNNRDTELDEALSYYATKYKLSKQNVMIQQYIKWLKVLNNLGLWIKPFYIKDHVIDLSPTLSHLNINNTVEMIEYNGIDVLKQQGMSDLYTDEYDYLKAQENGFTWLVWTYDIKCDEPTYTLNQYDDVACIAILMTAYDCTGKPKAIIFDDCYNRYDILPDITRPLEKWYHFALRYDPSTLKVELLMDTEVIGEVTMSCPIATNPVSRFHVGDQFTEINI